MARLIFLEQLSGLLQLIKFHTTMNSLPPLMTYGLMLSILIISMIGFFKISSHFRIQSLSHREKRQGNFIAGGCCGFFMPTGCILH